MSASTMFDKIWDRHLIAEELYRLLRLSLHDHRPGQDLVVMCDVANAQIDKIAAA